MRIPYSVLVVLVLIYGFPFVISTFLATKLSDFKIFSSGQPHFLFMAVSIGINDFGCALPRENIIKLVLLPLRKNLALWTNFSHNQYCALQKCRWSADRFAVRLHG